MTVLGNQRCLAQPTVQRQPVYDVAVQIKRRFLLSDYSTHEGLPARTRVPCRHHTHALYPHAHVHGDLPETMRLSHNYGFAANRPLPLVDDDLDDWADRQTAGTFSRYTVDGLRLEERQDHLGRGAAVAAPYTVRVYRLGLSRQLRAEVICDGLVIAWAALSGEGLPSEAVALARQWAASLGYPTPEPPAGRLPPALTGL